MENSPRNNRFRHLLSVHISKMKPEEAITALRKLESGSSIRNVFNPGIGVSNNVFVSAIENEGLIPAEGLTEVQKQIVRELIEETIQKQAERHDAADYTRPVLRLIPWSQWVQIPLIAVTITEVAYQRYQVYLCVRTDPDRRPISRLVSLGKGLRNAIAELVGATYQESNPDRLSELGQQLFRTFFPGALSRVLYEMREKVASNAGSENTTEGTPLRLRLEIQDRVLHYLPWEYLAAPENQTDSKPQLGSRTAPLIIARYTPLPVPPGPLPFRPPLRILAIVASPLIKRQVNPSRELEIFRAPLRANQQIDLTILENPTRAALAQNLAEKRPHILHYIGHGFTSSQANFLALRHPDESLSDFLSPSELGAMLTSGSLCLLGLQTPDETPNYQLAALAGFAAEVSALKVSGVCFSLSRSTGRAFGELYAQLIDDTPVDQAIQSITSAFAPAGANQLRPMLGFHQQSISSQVFANPYHDETRITPSSSELQSYQELIEDLVRETGLGQIVNNAAQPLITYLGRLAEQIILPHEQTQVLEAAWNSFEGLVQSISGQSLDTYLAETTGPDVSKLAKGDIGTRPASETMLSTRTEEQIDEIDFVRDSLNQLHIIKQQYGDKSPEWMQKQIVDYLLHLDELISEVKEG